MTFLERIFAWLKGPPPSASVPEKIAVKPTAKLHIEKPTINTAHMVNTITLSSDMQTLYLIDNGRAIEFKITEDKGILVGTLNGQVTVVTALGPPKEKAEAPLGTDDSTATAPLTAAKPGMPMDKKVAISTKADQWTVFFNKGNSVMALIGIGEIDTSIADPDKLEATIHAFPLQGNVVHIRRNEGKVEFQLVKRF
jgi:hypothetical protein